MRSTGAMRSMASTSSLGPCRPADSSAMRRSQRSRSTASCTAGLRSTWPPSARSWRGKVRVSCFNPAASSPSWPRASAPRIRPLTPQSSAWPARPPGRAWARWRVWRSTASAKRSLRAPSPPASSSAGWASQAERRRPMTSGRQASASQRWFSASQRSGGQRHGGAGAPKRHQIDQPIEAVEGQAPFSRRRWAAIQARGSSAGRDGSSRGDLAT